MTITIDRNNAAFEDDTDAETARILRHLADRIALGEQPESLFDYNGNKVATVTYE